MHGVAGLETERRDLKTGRLFAPYQEARKRVDAERRRIREREQEAERLLNEAIAHRNAEEAARKRAASEEAYRRWEEAQTDAAEREAAAHFKMLFTLFVLVPSGTLGAIAVFWLGFAVFVGGIAAMVAYFV